MRQRKLLPDHVQKAVDDGLKSMLENRLAEVEAEMNRLNSQFIEREREAKALKALIDAIEPFIEREREAKALKALIDAIEPFFNS